MSRVGIGIIGAGNISTQYLENLTKFADVEVRFVADVLLDRAAAQASAYGVGASGSVEELLARDDVQIVINLTIPAAHAEVDQQIIDAGTLKTVQGGDLTIAGTPDAITVNGSTNVICGGVKTANATVYLIDSVLMPPA